MHSPCLRVAPLEAWWHPAESTASGSPAPTATQGGEHAYAGSQSQEGAADRRWKPVREALIKRTHHRRIQNSTLPPISICRSTVSNPRSGANVRPIT
eukprot:6315455-Pyramimonas_sp.AAC.1